MSAEIRLSAVLKRKDPRVPVYADIPHAAIAVWQLATTTTVTGSANGRPFGRRAIKYHSRPEGDWFIEFTKPFLDGAGLSEGDEVELVLRLADMTLPMEFKARFAADGAFAEAYAALKPNHKRAALEYCLDAKTPKGRSARLDKIAASVKTNRPA